MKPLPFLLACVLFVAVFNFALDLHQRIGLQTLAPLLAQITPTARDDDAFDAQLAASNDPADLRKIARTQYGKRQDVCRFNSVMFGSFYRMNFAALLRSGGLLAVLICAVAAALRTRRAASDP